MAGKGARETNYLMAGCKDRRRGKRPTPPQGRAGAGFSRNSTPRRKVAKTQSDFFITKPGNQESSKRFHGFRASLWNCFWLRLCVFALKVFCMVAGRKDRGKRQTAMQGRAGAGCGRNSTPRRNRIFFYYETRKPRIIGKISWFPGF